MINRRLLRVKTVQILYSAYIKRNFDISTATAEVENSALKSYDLYNLLLQLLVDIHHTACLRNDIVNSRLGDAKGAGAVDDKLINNRFLLQLANNRTLVNYLNNRKLSWVEHQDIVKQILNDILQSEYYSKYIASDTDSYDNDKSFCRDIVKREFMYNDDLYTAIEEENIYWIDGFDLIVDFVVKTIKNAQAPDSRSQGTDKDDERGDSVVADDSKLLLPMYDTQKGENISFATRVIEQVLLNDEKANDEITSYLKGWDFSRILLIDKILLKCAIAELSLYPNVPIQIITNEYTELAKQFSTPNSSKFINRVVNDMSRKVQDNPFR